MQVFRDGVAEGQYNEILQTEVLQMKQVRTPRVLIATATPMCCGTLASSTATCIGVRQRLRQSPACGLMASAWKHVSLCRLPRAPGTTVSLTLLEQAGRRRTGESLPVWEAACACR